MTVAAANNDHLVSALVMIDCPPVPNVAHYRVRSDGCFPLVEDLDGQGTPGPDAAADGYWLLIPPLPSGRHTISVGAYYGCDCDYGRMVQNFEYELDVGGRTDLAMR